jgi:hypothetical protein
MDSIVALMNRIVEFKEEFAAREAFVDCIEREYPKDKLKNSHFILRHQRCKLTDLKYTIARLEVALASLQKEMAKIKV